ncbi:Heme chaperone HemW [Frankia sp. AgKG'84/4]
MPPDGAPAPDDGALPVASLTEVAGRPFGAYVHVPYCAARCGYCDFNTYTAADLGGALISSVGLTTFVDIAVQEIRLARGLLPTDTPALSTVFVGGGTPTLLPANDLARVLRTLAAEFGLAPDVEVTTEANPESVDPAQLEQLRAAGFTRISFGMQSDRPHVLAALDRRHTPGRVSEVMRWARKAGFDQVSLDLIYGAPGESEADWEASLRAAVALGPDHVSAYALTVEEGTKLSRRVRRGELLEPDDDLLADRYLLADDLLGAAGLTNYEISNWAREPAARCRHNLGYWHGDNWWGFGPGAHSHVGGVRWWNVRHPAEYAARLGADRSPALAREELDEDTRRVERVMLRVRLADGLDVGELDDAGRAASGELVDSGLVEAGGLEHGRIRLTRRGRLLTDTVVRALLPT